MPGLHPDDDQLADLAAEVLPPDEARAVEAHVLDCDRCAEVLADAERVRGLLLTSDPGPVPAEVWARIEAALAAEARHTGNGSLGVAADHAAADHAGADGVAADGARIAAGQASDGHTGPLPVAGWDGADPLDDPDRWDSSGTRIPRVAPPSGAPATGSLSRIAGSRRDLRAERPRRLPRLLLAAAAVVAVVVVTGGALAKLGGGSEASSGTAASSLGGQAGSGNADGQASSSASGPAPAAAPAAPYRAGIASLPIVATGTDYHKGSLASQVKALLPQPGGTPKSGESPGSRAPVPESSSTSGTTPGRAEPGVRAGTGPAQRLADPQRLAQCLTALGAGGEQLIAVDLARYEGREAAVIVLRPGTGGYEVWVVEPTCAPGSDGTLAYLPVRG